jgi:hypothetical protein
VDAAWRENCAKLSIMRASAKPYEAFSLSVATAFRRLARHLHRRNGALNKLICLEDWRRSNGRVFSGSGGYGTRAIDPRRFCGEDRTAVGCVVAVWAEAEDGGTMDSGGKAIGVKECCCGVVTEAAAACGEMGEGDASSAAQSPRKGS